LKFSMRIPTKHERFCKRKQALGVDRAPYRKPKLAWPRLAGRVAAWKECSSITNLRREGLARGNAGRVGRRCRLSARYLGSSVTVLGRLAQALRVSPCELIAPPQTRTRCVPGWLIRTRRCPLLCTQRTQLRHCAMSENLHTSGPTRQVCPQILSTLLHPQSRSTAPQRYLTIAACRTG
jgi:hypothetical protein